MDGIDDITFLLLTQEILQDHLQLIEKEPRSVKAESLENIKTNYFFRAISILIRLSYRNDLCLEYIKEIQNIKIKSENLRKEIEKIRKTASITGQATHFNDDIEDCKELSKRWLRFTLVAGGAFILATLLIIFYPKLFILDEGTETLKALHFVFSRAAIYGVIGVFFFFCVRNYQANRHNLLVSRHRKHGLTTYETLMLQLGDDSEGKAVILARAAECIYGFQPTGFTKEGKEGGGSLVNVNAPLKTPGGSS